MVSRPKDLLTLGLGLFLKGYLDYRMAFDFIRRTILHR